MVDLSSRGHLKLSNSRFVTQSVSGLRQNHRDGLRNGSKSDVEEGRTRSPIAFSIEGIDLFARADVTECHGQGTPLPFQL